MGKAYYTENKDSENQYDGFYEVVFIDNSTGEKLSRKFWSLYQAEVFVNKLRHSRKLTLLSYPNFDY